MDQISHVSAAVKLAVIELVTKTKSRSGWPMLRTLRALSVPRSVFYEWRRCTDVSDRFRKRLCVTEILSSERVAICEFALQQPKIGYRKLTWMMVDQDIAHVSESTVYRVLREADLLSRWQRAKPSSGEYNFRPNGPHQQWHTDIMYVWIAGRFYFLLSYIDAYSRYIVHHKLLLELSGKKVANELKLALSMAGDQQPRIVNDHGSEFVNRDVAAVIRAHNLINIKTKPRHPQSNGIIERFNGTVRDETDDYYGQNILQAERIIENLIQNYNTQRLHAALGYMTPKTWHAGNPEHVRIERMAKLAAAKAARKSLNQQRINRAA